jgi:hypothetical protein
VLIPTRDANVKVDIFNKAVLANQNILTADIVPDHTPISYFVIYVAMQSTGTLSVMRTAGAQTVSEQLNNNSAFVANTGYTFTIPVSQNETINLRYDNNVTISKLLIVEVMEEEMTGED